MSDGIPQHSAAFRLRRAANWLPLGLTYAFLYMGRYNLTVAKNALGDLMSLEQFGIIFGVGTLVYGVAFVVNGPLTDRLGGRFAILIAAAGAAAANAGMGWYVRRFILHGARVAPTVALATLYATNMYFQSFGAVAIVKVNSNWFHVRERGVFSAIFGTLISSGIYLAFDVGARIVRASIGMGPGGVDATWMVFFVPAGVLAAAFAVDFLVVRNYPSQAGFEDFDTGAARLTADDRELPTGELLRRILTHPVILTIAGIEFCTGVLRNGIMHWYPLYIKGALVLPGDHFLRSNWGLILFVAGVTGGVFAGVVSDKFFQSRRAPAAGGLYAAMFVAVVAMIASLGGTLPAVGWIKQPAAAAQAVGLRAGDLIVEVDGQPVRTRAHFLASLAERPRRELTVWREGKLRQVTLPTDATILDGLELRRNLVTVHDFPLEDGRKVKGLHWQGAWAWEVGLRQGDRIVRIDGHAPKDWESFHRHLTAGKVHAIEVERAGDPLTLEAWYPPYAPKTREYRARYLRAGPRQKLTPWVLGLLAFFISLCVIGTHGLLSGTATMDFGGKRGTATAVGVIDGAVYLGTALQSFALGYITSHDWHFWPVFLLPFTVVGFLLCRRIWYATPRGKGAH